MGSHLSFTNYQKERSEKRDSAREEGMIGYVYFRRAMEAIEAALLIPAVLVILAIIISVQLGGSPMEAVNKLINIIPEVAVPFWAKGSIILIVLAGIRVRNRE
jgi:hypothetical protein